ncbi:MAG: cysteine desulfurase [Bacteroidetes bacterium]|jgi:cysteine desulfurase|nr:cysteine desulfurase [Bacteroidota bacterium]
MKSVYLDYNATTPVDPRVLERMLPYFTEKFGNASSNTHAYGWAAAEAVEQAREKTASLLGCSKDEIYFTSGSTEGINLALKGIFENYSEKGKHIISYQTEHKAVLDTLEYLKTNGAEISLLPVHRDGTIDLELLKNTLRKDTLMVAAMYANNETGVVFPAKEIGEICHRQEVFYFSDTTQAIGKLPLSVKDDNIDACVISAHKIYGPKGTGAVYFSRKKPRLSVAPQIHGGGHEKGLRSGTLNVPGIVALGEACTIAEQDLLTSAMSQSRLRTLLEQSLTVSGNVFINGSIKDRLCNTTNLMFKGIKSEDIIKKIRPVAVAAGSACTSAMQQPSHVLKAMGLSEEESYSSVRFSLGRFTTEEDINFTIEKVKNILSNH